VTLKVLWPYITLKVRSDTGMLLREFYAGAVVPDNADPDDRDRLVRKGALVDEESAEAELAVPAGTPVPDEPPTVPAQRPAGNASQAAWLDYAVSRRADGVSEEDARTALGEKTRAELVAEFGNP
jgi:hypothetical protein